MFSELHVPVAFLECPNHHAFSKSNQTSDLSQFGRRKERTNFAHLWRWWNQTNNAQL